MPSSLLTAFTTACLILASSAAQAHPGVSVRYLEIEDGWTRSTGVERLLANRRFHAAPLGFDHAPDLDGVDLLIVGSFASEHPDYHAYMKRHARTLRDFVARGGVLLQFTQADQTEASPAFLPDELTARRCDLDPTAITVADRAHPLTRGLEVKPDGSSPLHETLHGRRGAWEVFDTQEGFRVLLAAGDRGRYPVLMEAEHGNGRIILSAMYLDKLMGPGAEPPASVLAMTDRFASNLASYVAMVGTGRAPRVVATPPVKDPDPFEFVEGSWTLAVLPDTQVYSQSYPHHFEAQTRWIADNHERLNIKYVVHLGDIVNHNTPEQWENAKAAMKRLDGVVPYAMAPGNHDYGPGGNASNRDTHFNEFFKVADYRKWATFGGTMEPGQLDNSYHTFTVGDEKFLILALEWGPRDPVVDWANRIVERHRDHQVFLITHAYMYFDETRYDWHTKGKAQSWNPHAYGSANLPGGTNDGQELWDKLVKRHPNFLMTLNGHVLNDGQARLTSLNDHGKPVHQILCNYQMRPEGGEGYLRLFEFLPDGKTIQARSYSPVLDRYLTDSQNQYRLERPSPSADPASAQAR